MESFWGLNSLITAKLGKGDISFYNLMLLNVEKVNQNAPCCTECACGFQFLQNRIQKKKDT